MTDAAKKSKKVLEGVDPRGRVSHWPYKEIEYLEVVCYQELNFHNKPPSYQEHPVAQEG